MVIHFTKHKGKTLGDLTEGSLRWFQDTWNPRKHWDTGEKITPSENDIILEKALEKARKKGGTKDGFGG